MNKLHTAMAILLGGALTLTLGATSAIETRPAPTTVVGTFDSRGVLMAYIGSDAFEEYLAAQKADIQQAIERARATGDAQLLKSLEALGPAMQERIHQQGFGTAPVDDIIARIEKQLPDIAAKAGVDVIVSKWALTYTGPAAEFVDVTELLAAEFSPDEETLKGIRGIVKSDPVPLDQLGHDH